MKKAVKALGIVVGIFFVIWLVLFLLQIILPLVHVEMEYVVIKDFLDTHKNSLLTLLTFKGALPYSIALCAVLGVALLMIIILIIVAASKKRAKAILYALVILLVAVPAGDIVLSVYQLIALEGVKFSGGAIVAPHLGVFMEAGIALTEFLVALFNLILWFVVLSSISKARRAELEQDDEDESEAVLAEPAEFFVSEELASEPVPEYVPEPEPEVEPEAAIRIEAEQKEEPKENLDAKSLAELIRDIVRDEMSRRDMRNETHTNSDNQNITGATFGGPLIVQYFNGMAMPQPAPQPQPEPAPAPVVQEVKPEPEPAPQPEPEPEPEVVAEPEPQPEPAPAPVVEPAPVILPTPVVEEPAKNPIIRIPFQERIVSAEKEMQNDYNEIKNELLSWGLKSRVSSAGDTFRLHRKTYVKLTIAGKSLKLYFALDPEDYRDSKIPVQDAGHKGIYAEIPLVFKVKSELSMRRCKQLIQDVCEKDGLEQGQVESINWVKEIKAELKEGKKAKKDDED